MLGDFFGLRERPFALVPDARFLYLGRAHREALTQVLGAIERGAGLVEVVGPVGSGKTMLCRALLERVDPDVAVAYIFNPSPSPAELLSAISREFGLTSIADRAGDLEQELRCFLVEQSAAKRRVLLVIDEAQNLDPEVLEQLQLLFGLEPETGAEHGKLIQIVLFGQLELDENLARAEIQELRQRISLRWELGAIPLSELRLYLEHRLRVAGYEAEELFSRRAIRVLHRASGGVPRLINAVADRSLLGAYAAGQRCVTSARVRRAARELSATEPAGGLRALGLTGRAALLALALGGLAGGGIAVWSGLASGGWPYLTQTGVEEDSGALLTPFVGSRGPAPAGERSAARAIDAVLEAWGYPSLGLARIAPGEIAPVVEASTPLRVLEMQATLAQLERLDLPAILEIRGPGAGRNYQALIGVTPEGRVQLLGEEGARLLSRSELLQQWNGRTLWLWTNFEAVPELVPGSTGARVGWLQGRLRELGDLGPGRDTHEFDAATAAAVSRLQSRYALAETGVLDQATLLALYQALRFGSPRIAMGGKVS